MQPLHIIQNYKCKINLTHYDFACLMIDIFPIPLITKLQKQLDIVDLSSKGIEYNQHITVVFGIDTNVNLSRVENLIPTNIGDLKFGKIGVFYGQEYDVLKVSVIPSEELLKLRADIVNKLSVTLTFPDFNPHITLAYLKKGTADKYLERFCDYDLSKEIISFSNYNYSSSNQNETFIKS